MRADQEVRNEPPGVGVAAERGWTIYVRKAAS